MSQPLRCAVCPATDDLRGVVVTGRQLHLCRTHAERLDTSSFDDLDAFFAQLGPDATRGSDRRRGERRLFPRPEGRRHNQGRRADDPRD